MRYIDYRIEDGQMVAYSEDYNKVSKSIGTWEVLKPINENSYRGQSYWSDNTETYFHNLETLRRAAKVHEEIQNKVETFTAHSYRKRLIPWLDKHLIEYNCTKFDDKEGFYIWKINFIWGNYSTYIFDYKSRKEELEEEEEEYIVNKMYKEYAPKIIDSMRYELKQLIKYCEKNTEENRESIIEL